MTSWYDTGQYDVTIWYRSDTVISRYDKTGFFFRINCVSIYRTNSIKIFIRVWFWFKTSIYIILLYCFMNKELKNINHSTLSTGIRYANKWDHVEHFGHCGHNKDIQNCKLNCQVAKSDWEQSTEPLLWMANETDLLTDFSQTFSCLAWGSILYLPSRPGGSLHRYSKNHCPAFCRQLEWPFQLPGLFTA